MANVKITQLPQINFLSITNNDVIPIVDVDTNTTSKVLISDLKVLFDTLFTGGTVSGLTEFTNGLVSNTISATTYQNLPIDVYVTGGTYNNGVTTFTDNIGGTFSVSGYFTGYTNVVNTLTTSIGLSADTTNGDITIINTLPDQTVILNDGNNISVVGTYPNFTINVTGLTDNDRYVTGFSYNNNTFTIGDNSGNTYDTTFNDVTGLTVNGTLSATTISGGTFYGDGSNLINLPQPSQIEYPVGYWTNFTRNAVSNINAAVIVKNYIYAGIHIISSDVSIDRVRCRISAPSGGDMIIGIYKYNYVSDIFDLILQVPGNINLAVGGTAQELTFVTPLTLTTGVYALATNSQNDASIDVISLQQYEPIFGFNSTMGSANWLCSLIKSETYTGTLPSTIATSFLSNVNVAPHLLFNVV